MRVSRPAPKASRAASGSHRSRPASRAKWLRVPKGTQTNAAPASIAAAATGASDPSPPAIPTMSAPERRASARRSSPGARRWGSIPRWRAASASSPAPGPPRPARGLISRKGWVLMAAKLSRTAHGGRPGGCRSFAHERTRPPSHRGRPRRDLARGLGRGGRRRDRGLPHQACGVSELPRSPGNLSDPKSRSRQRARTPPARNPLFAEPERALQHPLGHGADGVRLRLAALEEDHVRDRLDPVPDRQILVLVDIDLHELEVPFLGDPFEHRRDGVARAAPLRPEVDEHGLATLQHLGLERRVGDISCHSLPFVYSGGPLPDLPRVRTLLSTLRFPMAEEVFQPLPTVPDHPALERELLADWDRDETFRKLRERNA